MNCVLVTGSSGLIGSQAVEHFDSLSCEVHGLDNNMRREFFGADGDTRWNLARLLSRTRRFQHHELDIRDREGVFDLFQRHKFDLVIHCAAQPSHDRARDIPLVDFDVNAVGTVNLLEATRLYRPDAVFILMSTNKVYGDVPNEYPLVELETRFDYKRSRDAQGIGEDCRIDRCLHSLFGASKLAADIMTQEYGRYYGLKTGVFRGGCLTGPHHSAVRLHGFLSYLVKTACRGEHYTVLGYRGKQVRDQIHSNDVVRAFQAFACAPRSGEVYNLGGGRANSASILECIALIEKKLQRKIEWHYEDAHRQGDHICYISDMRKFRSHFPGWSITRSLEDMIDEMIAAELQEQWHAAA